MKKKSTINSRLGFKINTFLVFLILSLLFWFLTKLSKVYSDEVEFDINYVNLPADKILQKQPISKLNVSVQTTGFNLVAYKTSSQKLDLDLIDLIKIDTKKYYYLPNKHLPELKAQLDPETIINKVNQDTIFFILGQNSSKKIPIKLNSQIQFKLGYGYADKLLMNPDSITITGPSLAIDTIVEVHTKLLKISEVSNNIDKRVKLETEKLEGINFSNSSTKIQAAVAKFTEGSLKVPLTVINVPEEYKIVTLPNEVEIIYKVVLDNFNKITSDNFKVVCDYNETVANNLSYLVPRIINSSVLVTSAKLFPEKIEFLIEKK